MKFKLKPRAISPGMAKILLAMKLIAVILFLGLTQVHAGGYAQTISIHEKDVAVEKILKLIRKQTSYHFIYDSKLAILKTHTVTINADHATVKSILDQCLSDLPVSYTIIQQTIAVKSNEEIKTAKAVQAVTLKGQVTDENGKPLPGVSVKLKGSTLGVATDNSGNFSLTVPGPDGTLIFSFISYETQEISISGTLTINVKLKPSENKLNDVVVVGYGTQSRAKVSGAITTVSSKDVALSPSPNLADGISGRIPGVVINDRGGEAGNDGISINIRGVSTNGNSSPLYVIDGIVRDYGDLSFIPPADVESITILKDASAAIYGSRAANGVILVTTKRGKLGKPTINATYNQAWVQPERVPKMADAATYAQMSNAEDQIEGLPVSYSANDIALFKNGKDQLNHPNTDWPNLVIAKWEEQERADVSLSGGSEGVKYYIGTGYLHDGSPWVDGFTYDKQYHLISNIDAQVTKDLKVSLGITGRVRDNVESNMDWGNLMLSLPTLNAIYPNGLVGPGRTGNNAVLMSRDPDYGYQNQTAGNFTSTLSAEYKIPGVDGLALSGNFAYDYDNNYLKNWSGVTYYYQLDPTTGQYNKIINSNAAAPFLSVNFPAGSSVTSNVKLSYTHIFNQLHAVDAFIGYEQNTTSGYDITASRSNYASGAIPELFAGDSNTANQSNNGSSSRTGRENIFGRALYTYNDKYNAQFQFRYDGSDNFAPGKRWGFFPGVSGNWIISKENFMQDVKWIKNLKLRASWGEMGNDNVGAYQYLTAYTYGNNYSFNATPNQGLVQSSTPNPNITWEVAKTTDIGLDAQLFNGGLTATIDVFKTVRTNILALPSASVPAYTGLSLPDENIGSVRNQGIELDLSTTHTIGGLRFTVEGNMTYAKNTVINVDETPGIPSYQRQTGSSLGTPVLYESTGIFKSQAQINSTPHLTGVEPGDLIFKDVNGDGLINNLDQVRQPYGSMPEVVYGANFTFQYKGFDLILGFQGQTDVYGTKFSFIPFDPLGWGNFPTAEATNAWTPSNPNGTNPSPHQSFGIPYSSTWSYASMAFLKLKTAEFGYTFSSQFLNKAGFKSAKVFVSGSNLFFLHDNFGDVGIDPEATNAGWGMDQLRVINLGINFTL